MNSRDIKSVNIFFSGFFFDGLSRWKMVKIVLILGWKRETEEAGNELSLEQKYSYHFKSEK